jgi:antitoxin (DNA-binding transcriptional repressor) of toxin-antitoxin stability system
MALKGDRYEMDTDISFFMNETATRGCVVSVSTAGSGAAMDSSVALATVKTNASGAYPLGVLLNDMVNLDLTRQHLNQYKDEVQQGGKVTILRKGWVVTNNIAGTPAGGQDAYLAGTGNISATQAAGALKVGQFLSSKDADGYAKVSINI